jgi:Pycsar effector protein
MAISIEPRPEDPFADVRARGSVDYMLRTAQQQLVDLSGQADLKASIVMTTSAILTSVAAARLGHESVRIALVTFIVGLLFAMLCAVLALVPSFRTRPASGAAPNPLFFGHFGAMNRAEYFEAMADVMESDPEVYRTIVGDLHASGQYLLLHKFRYLRLSYAFFLLTFMVAGLVEAIVLMAELGT